MTTQRSLRKMLRWDNWFRSFIPQVCCYAYLCFLLLDLPFTFRYILIFVLLVISSVGIAASGYFINEYFDIESDRLAGKRNVQAGLSDMQRLLAGGILVTVVCIPWLYIPSSSFVLLLIAAEFLLFFAYSAPPFRLKRSWWLSIALDAIYAYILPFLVLFSTFYFLSEKKAALFPLLFMITGLLGSGLRNILLHQLSDMENDQRSGICTFPVRFGVSRTVGLIRFLLIQEILGWSIFLLLEYRNPAMWGIFLFYILFIPLQAFVFYRDQKSVLLTNRLTDSFYQGWLPLLCLGFLSIKNPFWLCIAGFHIAIFGTISTVIPNRKPIRESLLWTKAGLSYLTNYSIYYVFLLFGRNLKKTNSSMIDHLRRDKKL